jgi:hypothetical protein
MIKEKQVKNGINIKDIHWIFLALENTSYN